MKKQTQELQSESNEFSPNNGILPSKLRGFYHLVILLIHLYMRNWQNQIFVEVPYTTRMFYLTNISFKLTIVYFTYTFLLSTPLYSYIISFPILRGLGKFNYAITFIVILMYWGMIIVNPSLLYNNKRLPIEVDYFVHGGIFIINLIDHLFILKKKDSRIINIKFMFGFMIVYLTVLLGLYHVLDITTYPFIKNFKALPVILVAATSILGLASFTYEILCVKEKSNSHTE